MLTSVDLWHFRYRIRAQAIERSMIINWTELNSGSLEGGVKELRLTAEDFDDIVVITAICQAIRDGRVVKVAGADGNDVALNKEKT